MSTETPILTISEFTKQLKEKGLQSKIPIGNIPEYDKDSKCKSRYIKLKYNNFVTGIFSNPSGGITKYESESKIQVKTKAKAIQTGYSIHIDPKDPTDTKATKGQKELYEFGLALNEAIPRESKKDNPNAFSLANIHNLMSAKDKTRFHTDLPMFYEPMKKIMKKDPNSTKKIDTGFYRLKLAFNTVYNPKAGENSTPEITPGSIIKVDDVQKVYDYLIKNNSIDGYEGNLEYLNINDHSWNDDVFKWLGYSASSKLFCTIDLNQITLTSSQGFKGNFVVPTLKLSLMFIEQHERKSNGYSILGSHIRFIGGKNTPKPTYKPRQVKKDSSEKEVPKTKSKTTKAKPKVNKKKEEVEGDDDELNETLGEDDDEEVEPPKKLTPKKKPVTKKSKPKPNKPIKSLKKKPVEVKEVVKEEEEEEEEKDDEGIEGKSDSEDLEEDEE